MIQITHWDHPRYGVEIRGHGGGVAGCDIVCAAVSSLAQALHGYLANSTVFYEADRENGYAKFDFPKNDSTKAVYTMTVIGLRQIAAEHKDKVRVTARQYTAD